MLSKASLKKKLLLAFVAVSAFVIGVAVMGYTQMNKVQKEYGYISEILVDNIQKVSFLNDAGHEAHRLVFRTFSTLLDKDHKDYLTVKERFQEQVDRMETLNKEYRSTPFTGKEEALYEEVWKGWLSYKEAATRFFDKADQTFATNSSPTEAKKILDTELRTMRMNTRKPFEALMSYQDELARDKGNLAQEAFMTATFLSTVFSVIGVVFAMSIGFYFSTTISKTISTIAENILSSSTQTAAASEQLTSASSQLSQGATESAASLEETVSSLEELSSMVKLNSDHAKEANSLSQRSLHSAEQGEREITKLIAAMGDMSKSSKKIEEIINVIDDIAFQTNLLALNAAVEAARAGEQGKGFAVVADAVRNLAGRSAVAAKDINVLIKENVGKTVEGVQIADTSGASLKEILTSVKKVADLNSEISAASQEQASGIEQISKAMNHLDSAIQSNASSSEEVASSAAEMSSQAECLSELVIDMKKFIEGKSVASAQAPSKVSETKPRVTKNFSSPKQRAEIFPIDESEASKIGKAEGF